MADNLLVTGHRNFLVRALGFTAAGATLAVPVLAVTTPEDKIRHHMDGLSEAFKELYGHDVPVRANFNGLAPEKLRMQPPFAAYASVRAGPIMHPDAKTLFGYDDGLPMFAADVRRGL